MMRDDDSNLPVTRKVDVLVVGGGPAGVGAALAAARNGAVTLVVEQFNCLGGVATAGGHGHISKYDENGTGRRIVGGVADEIADRVVKGGFGIRNAHGIWFEVEGLKLLLDQMAEESGVELLYHTFFSDAVVKNGTIIGAVVQNKNGRQIISAKRIIDCTGDGDVAFHAGCLHEVGRSSDGKCQPVTLMFTIGGVDWERTSAWRTDYKMTEVWEEAQRKGDMRPFQKTIMGWWWTPTRPDQVGVNFTHVLREMNIMRISSSRRFNTGSKPMSPGMKFFFSRIFPLIFIVVGGSVLFFGLRGLVRAKEHLASLGVKGLGLFSVLL